MDLSLAFEPLNELFSEGSFDKEFFKTAILKDVRNKNFPGTPDTLIEVDYKPTSGGDILVKRIDPEKALGYSVYSGEQDYFDRLNKSLYVPSTEELFGGE